jgi:hypothetical protein
VLAARAIAVLAARQLLVRPAANLSPAGKSLVARFNRLHSIMTDDRRL